MIDLLEALATFAEEPGPAHGRLAELLALPGPPDAAAFTDLFVFTLYPYASVYLGGEGQLGGAARDRVAGFFRALGVAPPSEPDHLTVLLAGYAQLRARADDEPPAARAAAALLHEHLLPWLPLYLARVAALAPAPYPQWAQLLGGALMAAAHEIPEPAQRCLHLREAPVLADPRTDGHPAFMAGLLAPVCSGMVLTGADLRRAADDLQVGLRAGERRFVLDAMFAQRPGALLRWLAGHTRTTTTAWRPWNTVVGDTARWWATTADATRRSLLALAEHTDHTLAAAHR